MSIEPDGRGGTPPVDLFDSYHRQALHKRETGHHRAGREPIPWRITAPQPRRRRASTAITVVAFGALAVLPAILVGQDRDRPAPAPAPNVLSDGGDGATMWGSPDGRSAVLLPGDWSTPLPGSVPPDSAEGSTPARSTPPPYSPAPGVPTASVPPTPGDSGTSPVTPSAPTVGPERTGGLLPGLLPGLFPQN